MENLKLLLSYVIPFTKKIESKLNHTLEINYINGKKRLDSSNANYSYGKLHKIMDFGLSKITLKGMPKILLLGLGGGCVIESIIEKYHVQSEEIIAVEIDPVVIRLALEEFHLDRFKELKIIQGDALMYVQNHSRQFDIIIVDIFIDDKVPESIYSIRFWNNIFKNLKPDGNIIFNAGMNLKKNKKTEQIISTFYNQVNFSQYENVQSTNTVLIGHKIDLGI